MQLSFPARLSVWRSASSRRVRTGVGKFLVSSAAIAATSLPMAALTPQALAQIENNVILTPGIPTDFDKGRNVSVTERARPDYDPIGIRSGSLIVFPSIKTGIGYSDNIYLTDSGEEDSGFVSVAPAVTIRSDWNVNELRLRANGQFDRYFETSRRNQNAWDIGALGRLDVTSSTAITMEAQASRIYESPLLSDIQANLSVLSSYHRYYGAVRGSKMWGQMRATLAADVSLFEFNTIERLDGTKQDQSDRDRDIYGLTGQVEYALTPSAAIYAQAGYNRISYDRDLLTGGANRDSDSWHINGGLNMDLAGLLRGTVGLGYVQRSFDSPLYRTVKGLSVAGKIEYFPTELTTVTLQLSRTLQDSSIGSISAFYDNHATLRVDHELLRNLLLNASAEAALQDYFDSPLENKIYRFSTGAKYLSSRMLELGLNGSYTTRSASSSNIGRDFNELRLIFSVTLKR